MTSDPVYHAFVWPEYQEAEERAANEASARQVAAERAEEQIATEASARQIAEARAGAETSARRAVEDWYQRVARQH